MFATDPTRDPASQRTTRRVFLFGAAAVAATSGYLWLRRAPGVEASTAVHGTPGQVTLIAFTNDGRSLGPQTIAKVVKTDGQWFQQLGPNSFSIARQADTETPGFGPLLKEHRPGIFRCIGCDNALFSSVTKYDSGTGWPASTRPSPNRTSSKPQTRPWARRASKSAAPVATRTSATSFQTAPSPQACATA